MSRIGKQPIHIPSGVTVEINGRNVKVKGPKGEDSLTVSERVTLVQEGEEILVQIPENYTKEE